jgi:hypothetical protein
MSFVKYLVRYPTSLVPIPDRSRPEATGVPSLCLNSEVLCAHSQSAGKEIRHD